MDLYCSKRSKARVVGVISKIVFQLLTAEDRFMNDKDTKEVLPININFCLPLPDITIDDSKYIFFSNIILLIVLYIYAVFVLHILIYLLAVKLHLM